jgi:hypothetical protein
MEFSEVEHDLYWASVTSLRPLSAKLSKKKWRLSLRRGSRRPFPYVLFEEPLCGLVGFGGSSTSFPPGGKRLSLVGKPDVALDGGEADAKEVGGLGLGDMPRCSMAWTILPF